MPKVPNFVGPSYNLDTRAASVQRTINMVPVPLEAGNERVPWVFKDAPGLASWSAASEPVTPGAYVFLDNFTGDDGTLLSSHAPDIAPAGFSWAIHTAYGLELTGSGTAITTEAGSDGLMNSSGSDPALSITLPETYTIEFVGQASIEGSEVAHFAISTGPDFSGGVNTANEQFRVGVGRAPLGIGGTAYKVFVSWVRTGVGTGYQTYPIDGPEEVSVEVRHTPTEFEVYIDGEVATPDNDGAVRPTPFTPLTDITNIGLRADAHPDPAAYCIISRVGIFVPS